MSQNLITLLLPSRGLYCVCQVAQNGYIQRFFDTVPEAIAHLNRQDAAGHTMYLAQASFRTSENRRTSNAAFVRNFFFDIDCGAEKFEATPDKAYLSQKEGALAIRDFATYVHLPLPTIVNSGNGLYAHWLIDEDIPADKWKVLASILKQVATKAGFRQDPSRTSDTSSVLRPVGTTNRKNGAEKPVRVLHQSEPLPLATFVEALEAAARKQKVEITALQPPKMPKGAGLNDEFMTGDVMPESSLLAVANKCAQVRLVRDTKGNVDEPLWYNFLGMARHTTEGKEVVILQEWSSGHPDYDPAKTFAKIQQLVMADTGPTTCVKFAADSPSGCIGCQYASKITSPIILGKPEPVSIATPEEEAVAPKGFKRDQHGIHFETDGVWRRFYNYDLQITGLAYDHTQQYEVATVRHQMPVSEEFREFTFRAALVHDTKALLMTLADNHVQTSGGEGRKQMLNYIEFSMESIRAKRRLSQLHSQMGWKEEADGSRSFVLGETLFRAGAEPENIGFAKNVPEAGKAFCTEGELAPWTKATKHLGMPGMEPFAFAFLAGVFGAPLMKFTGYAGAMVALIGDSGIGKTLLGEWILSAYGDSQKLILLKDDTKNFLVQRLGLYGSLPLYVDEVSNIEGSDLSDLVYKITQGRNKGRLSRNGNERTTINSWNTIAVASSNHSLVDKLSVLKADASAEINRVMEINVREVHSFGREVASDTYRTFHANYGLAGAKYISYLTDSQSIHAEKIRTLTQTIDAATNAKPEERYWSAIAGAAIYGGLLASKLGLIEFSVAPILAWVKQHIIGARETKTELVVETADVLGQFLDMHFTGTLVTSNNTKSKELAAIIREPRGALVCRIDIDTEKLYISRSSLKIYLEKTYGSYTKLKHDLTQCGALVNANFRKVLGSNTYFGGSQQPVWEIDLANRALGRRTLSVVRKLEEIRSLTEVV